MSVKKLAEELLEALEFGEKRELMKLAYKHINHEDDCEICSYLADEHEEGDDAALNAIARNPNTPDEILMELADIAFAAPGAFGLLCDLIRVNPNASAETLSRVDEADEE